ncbi:MAG: FxsA family protein [Gammaproteobacteria bacterium]
MNIVQILLLLFLAVPFVEIYILLQVGALLGALPTIFLVVLTAVLGAWLLRKQGFATWRRFQDSMARGEIPAYEIIEGPILLVGGALLLTPGFFTDILGFICLIPAMRRKIAAAIIEKYLFVQSGTFGQEGPASRPHVIEGEFKKED